MSEQRDEERLRAEAKALFDDSVERLDAATLSRLNQGRQRALAEIDSARPMGRWAPWVPLGGIAAAAVVAVVVWQADLSEGLGASADSATEFEILMSDESFEMLEELEFYSWMDAAALEANGNVG